jgi:hypothetical protein
MKCKIHTFLLNDAFSQAYADKNHKGNPSEENQKFEWEDELEVSSSVSDITELKNETYTIQGTMPNENTFSYPITDMRLIRIESTDAPSFYVGCSESILDNLRIQKSQNATIIEIYLKDYEPFSNPIPGIYIASKSFPKELIF